MAQIKRDLFCISVRSRNYYSVSFEHTQGIRIGDAELRSGLSVWFPFLKIRLWRSFDRH